MQYSRDSSSTGAPTNDHNHLNQLPSRQSSFASSCAGGGGGDDSSSIMSIHKIGNGRKRGAEDVWICSMCTAENTELALLCDVCGTRKCRVERRDSMSSVASYSLDELLASDCFEYDGPDDGWEHQHQPHQQPHNESITTAGASSRQDSVSNESALRLCMGNWSLQDRDEWSCVTCTFVNQPLYLQCEMCGQSRPPGIPGVSSSNTSKKKAATTEEKQQQKEDEATVRRLQAERMQEVIVTELPKEKRRATCATTTTTTSTLKTAAATTRRRGTSPARLLPGGRSLSPLPTPAAPGRRSRSPLPPRRSRSPLPPSGRGRHTSAARGGQQGNIRSRSPLPPSSASNRPRLNSREQSLRFMDLEQQQQPQQQESSAYSVQKPRRAMGDSQTTETTFGMSSSTFNTGGGWGSFYTNNNGFGTSSFQGSSTGAFQWNYYDDEEEVVEDEQEQEENEEEEEAQRQMSLEDKVQKLQVKSPKAGGGHTVGAEASRLPSSAAAPASSSEITSSNGPIYGNSAEC